jgi:hypothetical protein
MITLEDFIGAIRRAPGEPNVDVLTKIGAIDLVPVQARCFRPRKLLIKEWRALWEEHGKERVLSDPAFLYLEPQPPWK